jgi:hypothetical protein
MTDKTAAKLPKMYWATPRRAARRDGARKEIAAKLDAEEWRDLVGAYLDAASAAVLPPSRLNGCSTAQG